MLVDVGEFVLQAFGGIVSMRKTWGPSGMDFGDFGTPNIASSEMCDGSKQSPLLLQTMQGTKEKGPEDHQEHLQLHGLTQRPGDDGAKTDWRALLEEGEADMILVASDIVYCALNACEALPEVTANLDKYKDFEPMMLEDAKDNACQMLDNHNTTDLDMTNLDEYEDFAPMTFEDTRDDGSGIPNNHEGYLEWYEVIEPVDDAKWFNFPHEIDAQIDEAIHFGTGMEILMQEDLLNLKFFVIQFLSQIARNMYDMIQVTFEEELWLLMMHQIHW